jgi:hypothetical protein
MPSALEAYSPRYVLQRQMRVAQKCRGKLEAQRLLVRKRR